MQEGQELMNSAITQRCWLTHPELLHHLADAPPSALLEHATELDLARDLVSSAGVQPPNHHLADLGSQFGLVAEQVASELAIDVQAEAVKLQFANGNSHHEGDGVGDETLVVRAGDEGVGNGVLPAEGSESTRTQMF